MATHVVSMSLIVVVSVVGDYGMWGLGLREAGVVLKFLGLLHCCDNDHWQGMGNRHGTNNLMQKKVEDSLLKE